MSETHWRPGTFVDSPLKAEEMAAHAMRGLGYHDARVTVQGADAGIDVASSRAIAQVKFMGGQTGRPDLQRLIGAKGRLVDLDALFFSASGYSQRARDYADEMDIALYVYDPAGQIQPRSRAARLLESRRPERAYTAAAAAFRRELARRIERENRAKMHAARREQVAERAGARGREAAPLKPPRLFSLAIALFHLGAMVAMLTGSITPVDTSERAYYSVSESLVVGAIGLFFLVRWLLRLQDNYVIRRRFAVASARRSGPRP